MSTQNSPEVYVPSEIYAPDGVEVSLAETPKHRYWLHLLLLALTFFTTLVVGARLEFNFLVGLPPFTLGNEIFPLREALRGSHLLLGLPFSLTLMLILLAHEMGHYLFCVRYGVSATLPFFIPFPTLIGTLGAFIRIKSPLRSRSVLFDIGIAGPIAGFIVALVVLLLRVSGMRHPSVPVWPEITPRRRWLAVCALLMLALAFAYIPNSPGGERQSMLEYVKPVADFLRHWHLPH